MSGAEIVRALERLGFAKVRQSGSHVIMRRESKGCVVPMHSEVKVGTLSGVLASRRIAGRIHERLARVTPNPSIHRADSHKQASPACGCPLMSNVDRKESFVQFHVGRLIDHVHLRVSDLEASKRFYRAVFVALGRSDAFVEGQSHFSGDELWVDKAAPDRETVEAFYQAALGAGGRDNGRPGERGYHPGYFAAFVLDPDENNIEAVFHGPSTRSAPSVVVTPTGN